MLQGVFSQHRRLKGSKQNLIIQEFLVVIAQLRPKASWDLHMVPLHWLQPANFVKGEGLLLNEGLFPGDEDMFP